MMKNIYLLADIGNTCIDIACYDGKEIIKTKFLNSEKDKVASYLKQFNEDELVSCLISSVNKQGLNTLISCLEERGTPYQVLDSKMMKDFCLKHNYTITNTDYLGGDLFLDVIAPNAYPLIVIDLGTVGKILFLDKDRIFYGCSIFPNYLKFPEILNLSTDLLKDEQLISKPPLVSLKTEECISSGAINGISSLISGLVSEIKKTYDANDCKIILTGGNAKYIKDFLPKFNLTDFTYDEDLAIYGLIRLLEN